ncbi:single-stranded-DNA-specific exonuclease RecJ [candidate division KSB1 bacterium]|jgi:single-stranded-DNA-specific exonuclease|nr:single-stranded-DNA-specific exonuclease RecJ [candidate division KSB1 bacterium]
MNLRWSVNETGSNEEVTALSKQLNVPDVISRILLTRGIHSLEMAKKFFRPSLLQLYDPFLMKDMHEGVERLRRAVLSDEKILIYGDYDVDGITSVSFLYMILKEIGAQVSYYIPDRQQEGYGLSDTGIQKAASQNTDLIVTVDCGITAHQEITLAKSHNIDVIVTDHHEPGVALPEDAVAVIDPKRPDCDYPFKQLAGVGVAYKLAQGLLIRMNIDLSVLEHYLEFVAMGTAADIVPLVDENRVFVKVGLDKINSAENIGLRALLEVAGLLGKEISTGHIVFIIAPRINAVGRMGDAERAVQLLTTQDEDKARVIADVLERENQHRKNVDEETFKQAIEQAESLFDPDQTLSLVLYRRGWHPGVIGIVASRVAERFYRPAILISVEDGVGKGSARSISGFDLYDALSHCEDLLIGFGGHKYAAGLSIEEEKIPEFRERFESLAASKISPELLIPTLNIDALLTLDQIDNRFMKIIKLMGPFGPHNMRPMFQASNLQIVGSPTIVGGNHLKFKIRQNGRVLDVIGFGMGNALQRVDANSHNLDLVFVVDENEYMGRKSIQLRVKDIR